MSLSKVCFGFVPIGPHPPLITNHSSETTLLFFFLKYFYYIIYDNLAYDYSDEA